MRVFLVMLVLSAAMAAVGETGDQAAVALSLEASVLYGLEHSTAARLARLDEDIARTQVGQAGSLALPQVTLDAAYRRLDELQEIDLGEGSAPLGSLDNYEVTAGVSQLLYGGGQVGAALRAARLARDHADAARRATDAGLVRDITVQFYGLLLADERVAVQAASVEQLRSYAQQTESRQQHGAVSEFELLTAQVRLANEQPKLIEARNQRELARVAFATLLNHPGPVAVTGLLEQVSLDLNQEEMTQLALDQRQELRGSSIRVGLRISPVRVARGGPRCGRSSIITGRMRTSSCRTRMTGNGIGMPG